VDLFVAKPHVAQVRDELLRRQRRRRGKPGEVVEILERRELLVEHHRFRDVREVALGLQRVARDVDAAHACLAGRGSDEVEEEIDGRALPGPVGAQQAVDLTRRDREVEGVERHHLAVALGEGAGGQAGGVGSGRWRRRQRANGGCGGHATTGEGEETGEETAEMNGD
jgi:hypothetical protein